ASRDAQDHRQACRYGRGRSRRQGGIATGAQAPGGQGSQRGEQALAEEEAMTDTRTDLMTEGGGTGAGPKAPRRVEVSVGVGGVGAEFDPIGHPLDPGDEKISNYTIN